MHSMATSLTSSGSLIYKFEKFRQTSVLGVGLAYKLNLEITILKLELVFISRALPLTATFKTRS